MRLLLFLLVFYSISRILNVEMALRVLSAPFHSQCLHQAAQFSDLQSIMSALVCGERVKCGSIFQQTLIQLGVIHLFVVSGAHLSFLEKWIVKVPGLARVSRMFLFVYVLASAAQPPVLRAWLHRLSASYWCRHYTPQSWGCFWPVAGCLLLKPSEITGLSLALSWVCTLAIHLTKGHGALVSGAVIYLLLIPILLQLGIPTPLSVLVNFVMMPVFSVVFFPTILFVFFFPILESLVSPVWLGTQHLLILLASNLPLIGKNNAFSVSTLPMIYAATLQLAVLSFEVWKNRRSCR